MSGWIQATRQQNTKTKIVVIITMSLESFILENKSNWLIDITVFSVCPSPIEEITKNKSNVKFKCKIQIQKSSYPKKFLV